MAKSYTTREVLDLLRSFEDRNATISSVIAALEATDEKKQDASLTPGEFSAAHKAYVSEQTGEPVRVQPQPSRTAFGRTPSSSDKPEHTGPGPKAPV